MCDENSLRLSKKRCANVFSCFFMSLLKSRPKNHYLYILQLVPVPQSYSEWTNFGLALLDLLQAARLDEGASSRVVVRQDFRELLHDVPPRELRESFTTTVENCK